MYQSLCIQYNFISIQHVPTQNIELKQIHYFFPVSTNLMSFNQRVKSIFENIVAEIVNKADKDKDYWLNFATINNGKDQIQEGYQGKTILAKYLLNIIVEKVRDQKKSILFTVSTALQLLTLFFRNLSIQLDQKEILKLQSFLKYYYSLLLPEKIYTVQNIHKDYNDSYSCICGDLDSQKKEPFLKVQACYKCGHNLHASCFWPRQGDEDLFECPKCFLLNCIPERPKKQILFIGYLRQSAAQKSVYELTFETKVSTSKNSRLEVRCCRLNKQNRFELTFPQNCIVSINGKKNIEFKSLSLSSPMARRRDREIVLQKRHLNYQNRLKISQENKEIPDCKLNPSDSHMVLILQTSVIAKEDLFRSKEKLIHKSLDDYRQMFVKLVERINGKNKDVVQQKINIPLRCKYFSTLISLPIRSVHCLHEQPYDLRSFVATLQLNSDQSLVKWKCPNCGRRSYDVQLDHYIWQIIEKQKNLESISLDSTGLILSLEREKTDQQNDNQADLNSKGMLQNFQVRLGKDNTIQHALSKAHQNNMIQIQDVDCLVKDEQSRKRNIRDYFENHKKTQTQKDIFELDKQIINIELEQQKQVELVHVPTINRVPEIFQSNFVTLIPLQDSLVSIEKIKQIDQRQFFSYKKQKNAYSESQRQMRLVEKNKANLKEYKEKDETLNGNFLLAEGKKMNLKYRLSAMQMTNSFILHDK